MTKRLLSRRTLFAGSFGAIIAACSSGSSSSPDTADVESTVTSSSTTSSIDIATTVPPTTAAIEPVAAPSFGATNPFALGVASGDPDAQSVVLWTRLIDEEMPDTQSVAVDVARDAAFADIVRSQLTDAVADDGHSVHLIIDGLEPDAWHHYRFRLGDHVAQGRTRTTPADSISRELRIGFSSCQAWESGTYAAHRHLAEADLDITLWLGDYIYEGGPNDRGVVTVDGPRVHEGAEPETLEQYRSRFAQYKQDIFLQQHHAARPWIVTWDDHEVQNNYAGDTPSVDNDLGAFLARRDAAYQAWWEHMPVRLPKPTPGEPFRIHRRIGWGNLVNLVVLDGRQYRDPQPTDGEPVNIPGVTTVQTIGPTAADPNHTMLGSEQLDWVMDQLAAPRATWTALANQVYMHGINAVPLGENPGINTDTWDGYHGERAVLLDSVSSDNNVVVLSGDFHAATVADVRRDPYDAASPIRAVEFMAPAISSQFPSQLRALAPLALIANPHVKHFEPDNGYMTCVVTETAWTTELHVLDDVTDESSELRLTGRFIAESGTPGVSSTELFEVNT